MSDKTSKTTDEAKPGVGRLERTGDSVDGSGRDCCYDYGARHVQVAS